MQMLDFQELKIFHTKVERNRDDALSAPRMSGLGKLQQEAPQLYACRDNSAEPGLPRDAVERVFFVQRSRPQRVEKSEVMRAKR